MSLILKILLFPLYRALNLRASCLIGRRLIQYLNTFPFLHENLPTKLYWDAKRSHRWRYQNMGNIGFFLGGRVLFLIVKRFVDHMWVSLCRVFKVLIIDNAVKLKILKIKIPKTLTRIPVLKHIMMNMQNNHRVF